MIPANGPRQIDVGHGLLPDTSVGNLPGDAQHVSTVWATLARALSPVEDRPRLAADIESAAYTTRSGTEYVVIHNPAKASTPA